MSFSRGQRSEDREQNTENRIQMVKNRQRRAGLRARHSQVGPQADPTFSFTICLLSSDL
jgi:hypothetical protein